MNPDQVNLDLLPGELRDIAESFGVQVALTMVERFGGRPLYFPKGKLPEDSSLIEAFGREVAGELQKIYSGGTILVPLAVRAARAVRNAEMRRDRERMAADRVAEKWRTTDRNVRKICNCADEDDRQRDLF